MLQNQALKDVSLLAPMLTFHKSLFPSKTVELAALKTICTSANGWVIKGNLKAEKSKKGRFLKIT